MTPLARHLAQLIAKTGPIPLSLYMAQALGHSEHGYYMRRNPLGAQGDFVTSPEISQMFGELLGLWCAEAWIAQDRPSPFMLVELGPGRGTLMQDALRALRSVHGFIDAARIHLVEMSPALRTEQAKRIPNAQWHIRLDELPPLPLFLIANEFFDALPISQFVQTERGWCERHIALAENDNNTEPRFMPVLIPTPLPAKMLPQVFHNAPIGSVFETSTASQAIMKIIDARIASAGGAALIIDYGHIKSGFGDTFQAVRQHAYTDPFEAPSTVDLTAHVDFEALTANASSTDIHGPVEQGTFLRAIGIGMRAEALKHGTSAEQARDIDTAVARLTGVDKMGRLFKVLGLTPRGALRPSGFP